ncbi:damage-inducible protein DinB [Metabacillus sp. KIGAM252]|uniref:Damage-inducible protein DinB n=1 Tax=Metabacillus flavus TaxID=2823519 RepID=A0ABS5LBP8_9BACI|nr:DinB family protein [Metabacillus flavus]MBS2967988.1 damage-inducible protein DinB [Metabacillus flavus]
MENHPKKLYEYNAWAHQRILGHLKTLPQDIFHKEIKSTFPSVSATMTHIYVTEYLWLQALEGKEMAAAMEAAGKLREELGELSLDEIEKEFIEITAQFQSFFNLNPDLEKKIMLNNPFAGERETSLAEIIFHIINHGTYHRGNISAMLHQLDESSLMTDYVYYWYRDQLTPKK